MALKNVEETQDGYRFQLVLSPSTLLTAGFVGSGALTLGALGAAGTLNARVVTGVLGLGVIGLGPRIYRGLTRVSGLELNFGERRGARLRWLHAPAPFPLTDVDAVEIQQMPSEDGEWARLWLRVGADAYMVATGEDADEVRRFAEHLRTQLPGVRQQELPTDVLFSHAIARSEAGGVTLTLKDGLVRLRSDVRVAFKRLPQRLEVDERQLRVFEQGTPRVVPFRSESQLRLDSLNRAMEFRDEAGAPVATVAGGDVQAMEQLRWALIRVAKLQP